MFTSESLFSLLHPDTAFMESAGFATVNRTLLEFTGPDRATFLHNLSTQHVKQLTPGHGCELFFPTLQGKVLGHGYLFCEELALVFDGAPGQEAVLLKHLDRYRIREKIEFHERGREWTEFALVGQQAGNILKEITGCPAPETCYLHISATVGGAPARIRRVDCFGPTSFFILGPASNAEKIASQLAQGGAVPCVPEALDILRVESGFPEFGRDITPDELCQEVNRTERAISFTKGCYLGQETIARIDALGHVNRLLVGLLFGGETLPPAGTELLSDGKMAGQVTSAVFSPRLNGPLALAYVRRPHAVAGTKLAWLGGVATVVAWPMV